MKFVSLYGFAWVRSNGTAHRPSPTELLEIYRNNGEIYHFRVGDGLRAVPFASM